MAHILLIDVPGGNDFTVLEDALAVGHEVTFFTSDLSHYERQGEVSGRHLRSARKIVEIRPFRFDQFEEQILAIHAQAPFDAVICLIDIRQIEASRIAERLGLRYLNPKTARLMRDKFSVRQKLADVGIRQPAFAFANDVGSIREAVSRIGFPTVIKPADGYGSQNISIVRSEDDLEVICADFDHNQSNPTDYGLGVKANNRFSVEQYVEGALIGCDVFSDGKDRLLIGVNEKLMYPLPSFAIKGGHFPSNNFDMDALRSYAFAILDAVDFDIGAAHIEMIVADGVPYLVEVNARLVSAQIPFQMGYALERSLYVDLMDLHLGVATGRMVPFHAHGVCAIRWIVADKSGVLKTVRLPEEPGPGIRRVILFKLDGDTVRPPISNGDRIGYVMAAAQTAAEAADLAESYIARCDVVLEPEGRHGMRTP